MKLSRVATISAFRRFQSEAKPAGSVLVDLELGCQKLGSPLRRLVGAPVPACERGPQGRCEHVSLIGLGERGMGQRAAAGV
ncbi:MAG: hypothetical protein JWM22_25 [Frankiales bacterium]|nr:hypothetical protein [Frankiales bacterium]